MAHYPDIAIALAGVCQSAKLVQQIAHQGRFDQQIFSYSLDSLLVTEPENTLAVFNGDLDRLELGLEAVMSQFGGGNVDAEIGRYWIGLLALSSKLAKNAPVKAELVKRLRQIERQLSLYPQQLLDEQMIANLAAIYRDLISPLGSPIKVSGPEHILSRVDVQNRIRATLLAGIRSGILWIQVGGSRWQFLLARRKIAESAEILYLNL